MKGHGGIYSVHVQWHFALELVRSVSSMFERLMKQTILTICQSLDPRLVNSERQKFQVMHLASVFWLQPLLLSGA